jgi:phosphatidylserine/phosphatidylglycerophosphate/cardiolipin synthase-like enzyme
VSMVQAKNNVIAVTAYGGDAKTLLAFDLTADSARTGLAGFTIEVHPPGTDSYYLDNILQLATSPAHAQVAGEPPHSSVNAPFQKFRWVDVPGLMHPGGTPAFGTYTYVVTPRYFSAAGALQPLDASMSVSVDVPVGPFVKGALSLSFTRGYVQSQAFVRHFGPTPHIRPAGDDLIYDTSATAGTNPAGQAFTYAQEYQWLGFTARQRVFDILQEVEADSSLKLDVFAYDLDEPDVITLLLKLGSAGRVRIILDDANSKLHHNPTNPTPEDKFTTEFTAQAGAAAIKRGKFRRYAHAKIFIVSNSTGPRTVLTGSTNFSITGLYVNANHVLVYDDRQVAATYADVFNEAWTTGVQAVPFAQSQWATQAFTFGVQDAGVPPFSVTFSPHNAAFADEILNGLVDRINAEGKVTPPPVGSVFFAVMELSSTGAAPNPVYTALNNIHTDPNTFSLGISDAPAGVKLYPVGAKTGVLVTGKPGAIVLPPPFNQVPRIAGHEIHHKFVVCGFRGDDPVVYCGSSNLALRGEQDNGDNLLAIHDADVATAFTIEALELVDHYNFLDSLSKKTATAPGDQPSPPPADKQKAAATAGWFLGATDQWAQKYFDPNGLHSVDRQLFGG